MCEVRIKLIHCLDENRYNGGKVCTAMSCFGLFGCLCRNGSLSNNKDCGSLVNPSNGLVVTKDGTEYGDNAIYTCNDGYTLIGSSSISCTADGAWSDSTPVCLIKDCESPSDITNGQNDITTTTYGSVATYTCYANYGIVGSSDVTCLAEGSWDSNTPACIVECPVLGDVKDGTVEMSRGNWATSVATYICEKNYALFGQSTRTCQSTGLWSGIEPSCLFAMTPDILVVFGVLFMLLFIVDIVVLGIWLYQQINKPQKDAEEEKQEDDIEDKVEKIERPDDGMVHPPPSFMKVQERKTKFFKIAPEIIEDSEFRTRNTGHPSPKKIAV